MYDCHLKRWLDVIIALVALIFLLPLFFTICLIIKSMDPGPILFVSERVGKDAKTFSFYKFRSMPVTTAVVSSDRVGEVNLSWIGSVLRRSNVDELPQLWNILIGDMSLIGPPVY